VTVLSDESSRKNASKPSMQQLRAVCLQVTERFAQANGNAPEGHVLFKVPLPATLPQISCLRCHAVLREVCSLDDPFLNDQVQTASSGWH